MTIEMIGALQQIIAIDLSSKWMQLITEGLRPFRNVAIHLSSTRGHFERNPSSLKSRLSVQAIHFYVEKMNAQTPSESNQVK